LTAGTIGALALPHMIGGSAQIGGKAGAGLRYQPVSGKYLLTGINHDNNALNASASPAPAPKT
jgi:hypothetical protein